MPRPADAMRKSPPCSEHAAALATAQADRVAALAVAQSELEAKASELADLRAEHARLQGIVDGSKGWQDEMKATSAEQKATITEQKAAITDLEEHVAAQKDQLQSREEEVAKLQAVNDQMQAELAVTMGKLLRTPTPSDWLHWDFSVDKSKNYAFVNDDGHVHLLRGAKGEWTHANLSEIVTEKSGRSVEPARSGCILAMRRNIAST